MSLEITRRWIEAGKLIAKNRDELVLCPVCQSATLRVEDVHVVGDQALIERYMTCPSCSARNSLRLKRNHE